MISQSEPVFLIAQRELVFMSVGIIDSAERELIF
jgi:hypothetical protein